ncbi:N-acetylated-alpha-linked acidic dipeptidase 2-like [Branchiostoma floridae]|uniref:N-acetylated-alpha-linked acidic dipeptidase 2-like n=1 Tax=Branchiostoma floridae TaxID=7739 RepID=A0A9J7HSU1_BRAFL|nr:N-acetylated-alpha-linked acidic dipeptidase 2-like [Branchiostoma floridae]
MSKGRYILLAVVCGAVAFALGVIIGWFSRSGLTAEDRAALNKCLASIEDADETIRDHILENIDAQRIRENLRQLSQKPHMAGTPPDLEMAELLRRNWLENGLDEVRLVPYDVLLSYPPLGREGPNNTAVTVDGADPARQYEDTRTLHIEPEYQDDPDAVQFFNAYSPAGHPVGELVFANYGRLEDFDYLRQVGVNCTGKIVLMKYRSGGRGQKAKNAASAGAIGAILYPEPADTNEPGGKVYPDGWNLPGTGTERGGALLETGDPLTPGYPATDYAYRLSKDKSSVFPPIPLQPIAYNDAQKYLSHLDGDIAPAGWNGSLPITYRLGPGFTGDWAGRKVALHVYTNTTMRRVYNVVGMIKGEVEPDRYVMLGNHYDSWVQGAIDDTSSTAISLELTRVFGGLVKDGTWRPRRSIVFVAWGAEEFGLIGSHEYVEQFTGLIKDRAVAYINMDIGVGGNYTIFAGCSPSMVDIIYDTTKQVPDPDASLGKSVYETWSERDPTDADADVKIPNLDWPRVSTDYIPFGLRVGTPLFTFAYVHDQTNYSPRAIYPSYHTAYDNMDLMERFVDPDFTVHRAMARISGELIRRLADSLVLPYDCRKYWLSLSAFLQATEQDFGSMLYNQGISIDALRSAVYNYTAAAEGFHDRLQAIDRKDPLQIRSLNDQMVQVNTAFIDIHQPHHSNKHVLYSPSGCATNRSAAFPGIVRTMCGGPADDEGWEEVKKEVAAITSTIQSAADVISDVDSILGQS